MEKQSTKKNFTFQILYQLIILVLPLVLSPYLTRVLGETSLGVYSFTYSIGYYFVIAAMLGISKYGQRIIASRRNDETSLRKTFWSLYSLHILLSFVSLSGFYVFSIFQSENNIIYYIQGIYVASAIFDITWLFYGLENFKSVVIKNLLIKLISTVLIFVFVKAENHLWIYTLIMSLSIFFGHLVLLPKACSNIKPIKFCFSDMREHIKPLFMLFVAVVASTLYTVFDKTLIGIIVDKENVAFYEYAYKIIQIPGSIILVIGTVLFPKSCACYAVGDTEGMKKYFKFALIFTYFISIGSILGLLSISDLLVHEYYGNNFMPSSGILKCLTPLILVITFGDIIRTQFLIPMKKDFEYILIMVLIAIINVILSTIFISKIGVYGAVIGTLAAETIGTISQTILCRKNIDFKMVIRCSLPFIFSGFIMHSTIELIKQFMNTGIAALIIQVMCGGITYCIFSLLYLYAIDKDIIFYLFKKRHIDRFNIIY